MPAKDLYKDDATLTSFLDNLISSADVCLSTPSTSSSPGPTSHLTTPLSEPEELETLFNKVNHQLSNLSPPFPIFPSYRTSSPDHVLRFALHTVLRLISTTSAATRLHHETNTRLLDSNANIEKLTTLVDGMKEKLQKKDGIVKHEKAKHREQMSKMEHKLKIIEQEKKELKRIISGLKQRETALVTEKERRESAYTALQKRVHSIMATKGEMVGVIGPVTGANHIVWDDEIDQDVTIMANVVDENHELKMLLKDLWVELDDIVNLKQDNVKEHAVETLNETHFQLPFDVARETIEKAFGDKLQIMRLVFSEKSNNTDHRHSNQENIKSQTNLHSHNPSPNDNVVKVELAKV